MFETGSSQVIVKTLLISFTVSTGYGCDTGITCSPTDIFSIVHAHLWIIFFHSVNVGDITYRWHGWAFSTFLECWPLCSWAIKPKLICVCIQEWPWVPVQLQKEGLFSHRHNRDHACVVVCSFITVNFLTMILTPGSQVSSISTYL